MAARATRCAGGLAIALVLALCAIWAVPGRAQATALVSIYPTVDLPNIEARPETVKLGSGSGWWNLRWRSWGAAKAVASGELRDHASQSYGFKARGKLVLSRPRSCGLDTVYTRIRHVFRGRQKRRTRYWRNTRIRFSMKNLDCPDRANQVFAPTVLAQLPLFTPVERTVPEVQPSRIILNNDAGLLNIAWSTWGGATAIGTGTSSTSSFYAECEIDTQCERTANATVTLSEPMSCGEGIVYGRVSFVEQPPGWTTPPFSTLHLSEIGASC